MPSSGTPDNDLFILQAHFLYKPCVVAAPSPSKGRQEEVATTRMDFECALSFPVALSETLLEHLLREESRQTFDLTSSLSVFIHTFMSSHSSLTFFYIERTADRDHLRKLACSLDGMLILPFDGLILADTTELIQIAADLSLNIFLSQA